MNDKLILNITFNNEKNAYNFKIEKDMTVNEVMFAISALMKCIVRDKVVEDKNILLDMINRYLNDPQFEEVKEEENEQVQ